MGNVFRRTILVWMLAAAAAPGIVAAQSADVAPEGGVPATSLDYIPPDPAAPPQPPLASGEYEVVPPSRVDALEARIGELEAALAAQSGAAPEFVPPAEADDPLKMAGAWGENGYTAATADGHFKVHIGGRVQVDGVALNTDDLVLGGVGAQDAVDFRRARLRIDGTMYQTMDWAAEFDFVNSQNFDPTAAATPITPFGGDVGNVVVPTDLWWLFREVPVVGNIRLGHQKDPLGLEHVQSSRFLDFLERSYLQDAFYGPFNNGFTTGVTLFDYNESETFTWAVGGYKNMQNSFAYDTGDNEYAMTGRLTCVPWSACEDRQLLHLGLGTTYRGPDQDVDPTSGNTRLRSRASLRNGPGPLNPVLADTNFAGRLYCENEVLVAPEAALVAGPWYVASEYVAGFLNSTTFTPTAGAPANVGQVYYEGSYVTVLYFLTGEHRAYDRHEARFGRVVPRRNAILLPGGLSGPGAWQVGARYGFLDLNDAGIEGGYIQDFTFGVNWFLNPHSKLQFNYILQHVENIQRDAAAVVTADNDGELHGFGVRFAQDF